MSQNDFVICASCGARTRPDRDRCIRCNESHLPVAPSNLPLPAWLTKERALLFGSVASLVVVITIAATWKWSAPADKVAQPAATASAPATRQQSSSPRRQEDAVAKTTGSFFDDKQAAAAAFAKGDFEAARAHYEQLLTERPNDTEVLNNMGQTLARQGRIDEAIAKLSRAAELSPDKWQYRFNLAHAFGQAERWDRAIAEYRVATGLFPEDYATPFNLALALHKKGDEQAAIPAFEKAIALAPSEPSFHIALAISLESVGRVEDAQRAYKQYLEMAPSGPDADRAKARLEALAGGPSSTPPKTPSAS